MINSKAKKYMLLYAAFFLYSFLFVIAKHAGIYPLLSWPAFLLYFSCFFVMGLYAILWQQILKWFPLTVAYVNRAVTIPLGMLWGMLLFGEIIKWNMLLGAAVIVCGILLMVTRDE